MNNAIESQPERPWSSLPLGIAGDMAGEDPGVESELARYLTHFSRMSEQLKQTSSQIESSVVGVCDSFQGIAERAKLAVARTTGFFSREGGEAPETTSFEVLIEECGETLVRILKVAEEAGGVSRRAIERIQQMDQVAQEIAVALAQLEQVASGNKTLALNARVEAKHAGSHGAGFAVFATEVISQTERSQKVNAQVGGLITNLRTLAGSALNDLREMNDRDRKRVEECKLEVDESLKDLVAAQGEMKKMLTGMTEDGALLANDIGEAVRGLQFQDLTSQRISHVVEDLNTLHRKLTSRFGDVPVGEATCDEGFSDYTVHEEQAVAGILGAESPQGDVELF